LLITDDDRRGRGGRGGGRGRDNRSGFDGDQGGSGWSSSDNQRNNAGDERSNDDGFGGDGEPEKKPEPITYVPQERSEDELLSETGKLNDFLCELEYEELFERELLF